MQVVSTIAGPSLGNDVPTAIYKTMGIVAIGAVVLAAPFVLHAFVTCKPGTVYAESPRCLQRLR
jgi:hypothetical protein